MSLYRNCEGYADPTAGAALAHIMREERMKKAKEKDTKEKDLRKTRNNNNGSNSNRYNKEQKRWKTTA